MATALPSTTPRQVRKSSTDNSEPQHRNVNCVTHIRLVLGQLNKIRLKSDRQLSSYKPVNRARVTNDANIASLIVQMNLQHYFEPFDSWWLQEISLPKTVTRRDTALEAFRHNPTDGSFAPPPARASA